MDELVPGLYEVLVTKGLMAQLDAIATRSPWRVRDLRAAEAPDRIAWHLSKQVEGALADVGNEERIEVGLRVARSLLERLGDLLPIDPAVIPIDPATVLHAVMGHLPDGRAREIDEPLIPLLDTTLLTNAPGEPNLWNQLRSEIESADSIDLIMAFIRRSGISPSWRHCAAIAARVVPCAC
jgi:hypothetical protein